MAAQLRRDHACPQARGTGPAAQWRAVVPGWREHFILLEADSWAVDADSCGDSTVGAHLKHACLPMIAPRAAVNITINIGILELRPWKTGAVEERPSRGLNLRGGHHEAAVHIHGREAIRVPRVASKHFACETLYTHTHVHNNLTHWRHSEDNPPKQTADSLKHTADL